MYKGGDNEHQKHRGEIHKPKTWEQSDQKKRE